MKSVCCIFKSKFFKGYFKKDSILAVRNFLDCTRHVFLCEMGQAVGVVLFYVICIASIIGCFVCVFFFVLTFRI